MNDNMKFCRSFPNALYAMDFVVQIGRFEFVNSVTIYLLIEMKIISDCCNDDKAKNFVNINATIISAILDERTNQ